MTGDELKHAKEQGQAQYDSIRELVAQLHEDEDPDRAREAILEDALSVLVRSGWYVPGSDAGKSEEFEILLCTGGPAARSTVTASPTASACRCRTGFSRGPALTRLQAMRTKTSF
jgi:hypothetical protein